MTEDKQDDRSDQEANGSDEATGVRVPSPSHLTDELWRAVAEARPGHSRDQFRELLRGSITEADFNNAAVVLLASGQRDGSSLPSRWDQQADASWAQLVVLAAAVSAYRRTPDQVREFITQDPAAEDLVATSHRKQAVKEFRHLLEDDSYFDEQAEQLHGSEAVWQQFLENNQWIMGGSLSVQFLHAWSKERLEQTVVGSSVKGEGKRSDALLRTAGRVHSLVFVEIKHHRTKLLGELYRPGIWAPSKELSGGVAQVQGTVQRATMSIQERLQEKASDGSDIGGAFSYLLRPRSYLIIGNLEQLHGENGGLHTDKFQSFELYRRHTQEPEIITFDELLARAEGLLDVSDV